MISGDLWAEFWDVWAAVAEMMQSLQDAVRKIVDNSLQDNSQKVLIR